MEESMMNLSPYPLIVLGLGGLMILGKSLYIAYKRHQLLGAVLTLVTTPLSYVYWAVVLTRDGSDYGYSQSVFFFFVLQILYLLAIFDFINVPLPLKY
jgi:hypothetical protein